MQCNINHINAMARPIKETPVVTGKDAKRFAEKWQISNLKARKRKKPQRKFMRSSKPLFICIVTMAIENYDFVPLKVDTNIKPFKCTDNDLNGFLFDDSQNIWQT